MVSCGQKSSKKTSVHLTSNFVVAGQTGGVILLGQNLALGKSFMTEVSNNQEIDLDSGVWDFLAISWDGTQKLTGNNRCAFSIGTNLDSLEANVNLSLTRNNCLQAGALQREVFGDIFQNASPSAFKTLSIHSCNTLNLSATGCAASGTAPITGSVKVIVPLDKISDTSPFAVTSSCYTMSTVTSGERSSISPIKLPAYTNLIGPVKPIITLHSSGDCTDSNPIVYRLDNGLSPHEDQVNGNFTLISDIDNTAANEIKVYLEHNSTTSGQAVGLELVSSNLPATATDYNTVTSIDIELNNLYDNDTLKVYFNDSTCTDETFGLIGILNLGALPANQNTVTFAYPGSPLVGSAGKFRYYIKVLTSSTSPHLFTSGQSCQLIAEVTDPTSPISPNTLSWSESTPNNTVGVTANWVTSSSTDIVSQQINFFTDSICSAATGGGGSVLDTINSQTFTGSDGMTYYFNITAIDFAGNMTTSSCSTAMEIDITPPALPTALIWTQASPTNNLNVNAQWTPSASGDVDTQRISYYSDSACTVLENGPITHASNINTDVFTGSHGNTYYFQIEVTDYAGNSNFTGCSAQSIEIDTVSPVAATLVAGPFKIGWSDSNNVTYPANSNATWTPSSSPDVVSQEIKYYYQSGCASGTSLFSNVMLGPSISVNSFGGADATAFRYKIITTDAAGNESESVCSEIMNHL